jgi:hypothetical protein
MIQWHPIFAQLLRPAVEAYYEVETTFPVGDPPREADFVLLRRMPKAPPPFRGLWRNLTPLNVLEFKGPTVSPRRGHIENWNRSAPGCGAARFWDVWYSW